MRTDTVLRAVMPDSLFPLTVTIAERTETRDDFGGREETYSPIAGMSNIPCLFTHAVRGAVRDEGMRKVYREHVRPRAGILLKGKFDVPYGAMASITWPAAEAGGEAKTEHWRVIGTEHRPLAGYTRCPIEQMDGMVRS